MRAELDQGGYAFLILLDDPGDSLALAQVLTRLRHPASPVPALFLIPPVRGLAFFADPARQSGLDSWWSAEVPGSAQPVYLLMDAEGLEDWLPGVDGTFYIGVRDSVRMAAYSTAGPVRPLRWTGPLDFAAVVMHDHCAGRNGDPAIFDAADALRMAALSGHLPQRPEGEPSAEPLRAPATESWRSDLPATSPTAPRRHDLLIASPTTHGVSSGVGPSSTAALFRAEKRTAASTADGSPQGAARGSRRLGGGPLSGVRRTRRSFRPHPDANLAQQLAGRGSTIVVTGSRKGGVGKTSFAAGIAIASGSVLDQIGHMACIVDANIANPDAWGQMNLPAEAATVRDTVSALLSNRDTPRPVHATTPALACYPEVREAGEYSRTGIRRLAEHLRRRYTLIVIDMSNRLPDPTAGPEAAVAAYWLEVADVLVLPTASARADFNGALDYLDVGGLPPTVVAYIVPTSRRLRDNPATLEYVRALRRRATSLVEVPDDANAVRLAGMEGVPVEQLSSRLRLAYRELAETIAAMPRRPQA